MTRDEFAAEVSRKIDGWTALLDSGTIKPLHGTLTNQDGTAMCCLGVYLQSLGRKRNSDSFLEQDGSRVAGFPSSKTMVEIGLDSGGGLLYDADSFELPEGVSRKGDGDNKAYTCATLSEFNDWKDYTDFSEISAIIKLNKERMIEDAWTREQKRTSY